jgi:tRNA G18 (ribose-2'-O)-methylase SpoU
VRVVRIESLDDPRVADYRDVREPELRTSSGLFIVEGRLPVEHLIQASRFAPRSLFVNAKTLEALRPVLETISDRVPVYVAEQAVLDGVVGFPIHRGCLATGERQPEPPLESLICEAGAPSLLLGLEQIANPDNMGGLFRNAQAFGADGAILSPSCCDPLYRKSIRVSVGATLTLPFTRTQQWPEVLGRLHAAGYVIAALHPGPEAMPIAEASKREVASDRVVLLIGTEGPGLSAAALEAADLRVRIPMAEGVDSLNAATATGIALHRFAADRVA